MPAQRLTRDQALDRITEVFRRWGYDGATLRMLSEATGLGRASLYHHFPGGKEEMAHAVFAHIGGRVQRHVIDPLSGAGTPRERLERHARGVSRVFDGGKSNCLWGAMVLGGGIELFADEIETALTAWIRAVAAVLRDAGVAPREATRRAEAAMVRVQGALVVSRGLASTAHFQRVIKGLPSALLGEV